MPTAAILGAGFIGQSFIEFALANGYLLRVLDHKKCPAEFDGKLTWVQGDLSNEDAVKTVLEKTDIVFHFISSTVPGDVADEGGELIQNVVETLHLLKLCVQEKVSRVVFISSASVYGMQPILPVPETALTDPISSHGIHKLSIEKYLQLYKYQYGLDCKIMRLSNPYGARQSIKGRQGFVAIALGRILEGDVIAIRGDGSAIRDFVYIDDVCDALHLLGTTKIKQSVFNIGSGQGYSLNQVVETMAKITGKNLPTEYVASRFVDIPASVLDISSAQQQLGYRVKHTLEQGLTATFAHHGIKMNEF